MFSYLRMCSLTTECVVLLSSCRTCSLTTECVLSVAAAGQGGCGPARGRSKREVRGAELYPARREFVDVVGTGGRHTRDALGSDFDSVSDPGRDDLLQGCFCAETGWRGGLGFCLV